MLEDAEVGRLIPEIYRRLCMMPEEWRYEFDGPHENTLLEVFGGARSPQFTLTPVVLDESGELREGRSVTFSQFTDGVIEVAGETYSNSKAVAVDDPTLELHEWLCRDPWSLIT